MKRRLLALCTLLLMLGATLIASAPAALAASSTTFSTPSNCITPGVVNTMQGTLGGAYYTIQMPPVWNGTLVLYSHGYVFSTSPLDNPAPDVGDALTGAALLQQGYALAGSSYSANGWALQQAFSDQINLLNYFDTTCGNPSRTIAWGHSLGGMITAGLVQLYPNRFQGAIPMCAVDAGGVGTWNQALDAAYAFDVLLAGNGIPIVRMTNPLADFGAAESALATAQGSPQGQARIALFAALSDIPGWFNAALPEPGAKDYAAQEYNQFLWESQVDFYFAFFARAELEARAGGNPSWNTGVNYNVQLNNSADYKEVAALYKNAGLNLNTDLHALAVAPRISADPVAVSYLNQYITYNGQLGMPVLTMHTTGDGLVVNQDEQAYKSVVNFAGDSSLLRQVFVHRAGHCTFTPAETLTAFQTLINRLNSGKWGNSTSAPLMEAEATALGTLYNTVPPAFVTFTPTVFLRPYDVRNE